MVKNIIVGGSTFLGSVLRIDRVYTILADIYAARYVTTTVPHPESNAGRDILTCTSVSVVKHGFIPARKGLA